MCIVSAMTTYPDPIAPWPNIDPEKYRMPNLWYTETKTDTVIKYPKGQFGSWNYGQCLAYVELLEKAQAFDKINNEPHCSDPDKRQSLSALRERICQIGLEDSKATDKCLKLAVRLDNVIKSL